MAALFAAASIAATACIPKSTTPATAADRQTVVATSEGPAAAPLSTDWQVVSDETVPLGPGLTPSNISFSPKGDRIVLSSWTRQAKKEPRDAELLFVPLAQPAAVERVRVPGEAENGELRVAWSHDGKVVAYSSGPEVRIFDLASRRARLVVEWKGIGARWVRSLTFSPDDRRIAALVTRPTGVRYAVIVINVSTRDTHEYPVADQTVELAGWSVGESLALIEWDRKPSREAKKRIGALDLETGRREKWALPRGLDAASTSKEGGLLAIDPDGVVWELAEGRWTRRFAVSHKLQAPRSDASRDTLHFDAVGLAPDGKAAVVSEVEADGTGGSGLVRVLRLEKGQ